jgi:hypothetical protein
VQGPSAQGAGGVSLSEGPTYPQFRTDHSHAITTYMFSYEYR